MDIIDIDTESQILDFGLEIIRIMTIIMSIML